MPFLPPWQLNATIHAGLTPTIPYIEQINKLFRQIDVGRRPPLEARKGSFMLTFLRLASTLTAHTRKDLELPLGRMPVAVASPTDPVVYLYHGRWYR